MKFMYVRDEIRVLVKDEGKLVKGDSGHSGTCQLVRKYGDCFVIILLR